MAKTDARSPGILKRWRFVLRTGNPPRGRLDPVSRWLVLTRAAVLPMTLTAAAIAGLLAVREPGFDALLFGLAAVGILLAHAANNLMNDLFDLDVGSDSSDYPRALYAPHPVLSGMTTRSGLLRAALVVNAIDLVLLGYLTVRRGWPMIAFALAGFLLSAGYTAPPLRLKKRGLGEPTVVAVWGPLMVGGCFYAALGSIPWQVYAASVPYSLLCTAVLFGKHIDKAEWDGKLGIRTLPVMLGEVRARAVNRVLMAAFYVSTAVLVAVGALPLPTLLCLLAIPTLAPVWRLHGRPRPVDPPARSPLWPLWFAPATFLHTRRAGGLFVLGLAVAAVTGT